MDMDWEEQRSELIDGLLSTSSPCQLATQEAVSVLLFMAQDDSSASGSGAESPQVTFSPYIVSLFLLDLDPVVAVSLTLQMGVQQSCIAPCLTRLLSVYRPARIQLT